MKIVNGAALFFLSVLLVFVVACTKNETRFLEDAEYNSLSIFSNTGSNVMSCYVNGAPWRTYSRVQTSTFIFGTSTSYEVMVRHRLTSTATIDLSLEWTGYYLSNKNGFSNIVLQFAVPGTSFRRTMMALQGQRLRIDTFAGNYFLIPETINQTNYNSRKTGGSIYFETVEIDSLAPDSYSGKLAGIYETSDGPQKITKGRFDHLLVSEQFR